MPSRTASSRPARRIVAVLAVALLAACGDGAPQSEPTGATSPGSPTGDRVEALARSLQGEVEKTRGLRFREPPRVALLDDAAFRQRLKDKTAAERDEAELRTTQHTLRALRLIPGGLDLTAAVDTLLGAGVVGFYDPKTKELVVRGASASSPLVRHTLVHELTHALQDQHFGIDLARFRGRGMSPTWGTSGSSRATPCGWRSST